MVIKGFGGVHTPGGGGEGTRIAGDLLLGGSHRPQDHSQTRNKIYICNNPAALYLVESTTEGLNKVIAYKYWAQFGQLDTNYQLKLILLFMINRKELVTQ